MAKSKIGFTNYYAVLGVSKNATPQSIQKAFWALARCYHPDLNHSPLAEERYKQIVDAYQALKSPTQRNDLDAQILTAFCQHFAGDILSKNKGNNTEPSSFQRILMDLLITEEVTPIKKIYNVAYPMDACYRQLLFVGPPGAGKSMLVNRMRAWPEEGNLDLSLPEWWRSQALTVRPRELHLLFPFPGHAEGRAVFERSISHAAEPCRVDLSRIKLPPPKKGFFSTNWQKRYLFDFLLPDPEQIFAWRLERAQRGTHPGDLDMSLEIIQEQYSHFERVARYLHLQGVPVIVRRGWDQPPLRFVLSKDEARIAHEASQQHKGSFIDVWREL